jgi:heparanase 1
LRKLLEQKTSLPLAGLPGSRSRTMRIALFLLMRSAAGNALNIQISDGRIISTPNAGFASFTMDFHPASQGSVWGKNASILEIDLHSTGLLGVARALAPGILRLGGSEAGQNVTYTDFPGDMTPCPSSKSGAYYYCLSLSRWDAILSFANATGVRLMLDLNIIGPGDTSDWNASLSQIDALFAHTSRTTATRADAGGGLWAFELGNENQGELQPKVAAERVFAVARSLARHWPERATRPLLVGPSPHIIPDWMHDFIAALAALEAADALGSPSPALDIFSYHMYSGYGKAPSGRPRSSSPSAARPRRARRGTG